MKGWGNISPPCLKDGSGIIDALIFFDVSQGPFSKLKPHLGLCVFSALRNHQTAKVSMLTEATLKQLEVLSGMLWLMSKLNKSSKSLKANIVDWTPSSVSENLSISELRPNQIQILRSRHESRRRSAHGHTRVCAHTHTEMQYTWVSGPVWCSCIALWVMSWGMRRGRAGPELLRCSFVYPDGFQMLASDRSAAERWGSRPAVWVLGQRAKIKVALSGILEKKQNMVLLFNYCNCFQRGREFDKWVS